jgi:hypothetical protein
MSKNFNGVVDGEGSITFPVNKVPQGMCIDLNHGNIWTPIFSIDSSGTVGSIGGWTIQAHSLEY